MARIVICEDDAQISRLIEFAMRTTPHTIEMTENGLAGLAAIERLVPDLIVTDVFMPVMSGFELADAVHSRESLRHIPILFVTASVQRDDITLFEKHGAAGYVAKPFTLRELREKIDEVIAASSARKPVRTEPRAAGRKAF